MRVTIERVMPGQREKIELIQAYLVNHWHISEEEAARHLAPHSTPGLPQSWVAVLPTHALVGHVMLALERDGFCGIKNQPWLQALFVQESLRMQGIGHTLVRIVEEACRRFGYRCIYLDTIREMHFYRNLGWEDIGTDVWVRGTERDAVTVMRKRLVDILNPSPKVIEALTNLNLPTGVTIDVKMI